ncbi:MAG: MaoC family dehydratase [Spongiibacteraceae bacterium]
MTASNQIILPRIPSMPPLLLRAAISRKKAVATPNFPDDVVEVDNVACDPKQLARYNEVCGFDAHASTLPASFLHLFAFRLQMTMMLNKNFPLAPMGIVHLRNTIRQYRAISPTETFRIRCRIAEHQLTDKGQEFSFFCEAFVGDKLVWDDLSTYLSRTKSTEKSQKRGQRPEPRNYAQQRELKIGRNHARSYARASGDFNPIHLHDLSAKLLGFPRMVVHGMWSKAACLAQFPAQSPEKMECRIEFKTPVFLPSTVKLVYEESESGVEFEMRNAKSDKPHLVGSISAL